MMITPIAIATDGYIGGEGETIEQNVFVEELNMAVEETDVVQSTITPLDKILLVVEEQDI